MEWNSELILEISRIITGFFGAYLLFKEVRKAHGVESLHSQKKQIESILNDPGRLKILETKELFETTFPPNVNAKRELLIKFESSTDQNHELEIRRWYEFVSDKVIDSVFDANSTLIKSYLNELKGNQDYFEELKKVNFELQEQSSNRILNDRKRALRNGFILIAVSFCIDLVIQFVHKV